MKIASVLGARPQFIKAATLSRVVREVSEVQDVLIHTGQHYDEGMSDVFFTELEIPAPDYSLGVGSGPHGYQTGRMLEAVERVLEEVLPDWVLVYGDTNSTLAGALAAAKLHLPVAHVEAGLRSFNRRMAEEINRVLTDHLADALFAPTEAAVDNLRREGIDAARIRHVGDVMYDAALHYARKAEQASDVLRRLGLLAGGYVLATVHRAESTDDPLVLQAIFEGLALVANDRPVIVPLHPRTRAALRRDGLLEGMAGRMRLLDPVGYLDMMMLEKHAAVIATDSGGVQKEAFFHRTPCVVLRSETEWVETVELGWNRIVPPRDSEKVAQAIIDQMGRVGRDGSPYGDGAAARAVLAALQAW